MKAEKPEDRSSARNRNQEKQEDPYDDEKGRPARDSTGINPKKREPVDPSMPNMPPA